MAVGIDISTEDLDVIASAAKDYITLVIATTITLGQGGQGGLRGLSSTQINALITRYFNARRDKGSSVSN